MKNQIMTMVASAALLCGCQTQYLVTAGKMDGQEVRYLKGVVTVFDDKSSGSVQVTPLGVAEGRIVLGVAAFNKGPKAQDFGIENMAANFGGAPLKIYSRNDLEHEARVHAEWAAALTILAGAAAAYAANNNAYRTTNGYVATPRGIVTFSATTYDPAAAALGTAAATAGTGYALASIRNQMDDTISHVSESILQTTTITAGQSYGGEMVFDMPKAKDFPQNVIVTANLNGQDHQFTFIVGKVK